MASKKFTSPVTDHAGLLWSTFPEVIAAFDTSVLYDDLPMTGPRSSVLLDRSRRGGYELLIPDVVVIEVVNHVRERIAQATGKIASGHDTLRKLDVPQPARSQMLPIWFASLRSNYANELPTPEERSHRSPPSIIMRSSSGLLVDLSCSAVLRRTLGSIPIGDIETRSFG